MRRPPQALTAATLRRRNRFPPIAFVYDREAWLAAGGYREHLRALGDWDFNVRFSSRFKIGQIPDVLAYWHHRPRSRRRPAGLCQFPLSRPYGMPDAAEARMGRAAAALALSAVVALLRSAAAAEEGQRRFAGPKPVCYKPAGPGPG